MVHAVFHVPSIPPIESTVRYSHALAFARHTDGATLITHSPPPDSLAEQYDATHVVDDSLLSTVRRSRAIAEKVGETVDQPLYVTSFHYEPAFSGYRSNLPWVVDVYDDPMQYAMNEPYSHHQLTVRVLLRLLRRADGALHVYHPSAPRTFGNDQRFLLEGSPIDTVTPHYPAVNRELRAVWAGSPRIDRGMSILLRGLSRLEEPSIHVDVYGEASEQVEALLVDEGVKDLVTLHGRVSHESTVDAIRRSHLGLCVLPARPDWQYATPVKVREYMAGGTVPIASAFSGIRSLAGRAGVYTDPDPGSLARLLRKLCGLDSERLQVMMRTARKRAETNPIKEQRKLVVDQAISAGHGIERIEPVSNLNMKT